MDFIYFKSVTGIVLVLVLIITFINLMSIENTEIQLKELVKSKQPILRMFGKRLYPV